MTRPATISAMAPLKSPPGFVSIRVGAAVLARLHAAEVETAGVRVGEAVTPALVDRLHVAQQRSAARRDAERLLARKAASTRQLGDRLAALGHAPAIVAEIVAIYRASGAIDDARLAESAAARARIRGRSARAIEDDLLARGIDATTARTAARAGDDLTADLGDAARALAFARSRLRPSLLALPAAKQRRRLAGMLVRRGYDETTIESVLDELARSGECPDEARAASDD